MPRASSLFLQAWDGIHECEGLLRVVTIGSGQLNSERNPATVANQMTLAAQLGPVSRIRPRLRPQKLPGQNCRRRRPATNQFPRSAPASPAKRSGSVTKCLPLASHVTAASRSCQNSSPVPVATSPTAEHEENSRQTSTVLQAWSASLGSTRWRRQQRLNQTPQSIGKQRSAHGLSILALAGAAFRGLRLVRSRFC